MTPFDADVDVETDADPQTTSTDQSLDALIKQFGGTLEKPKAPQPPKPADDLDALIKQFGGQLEGTSPPADEKIPTLDELLGPPPKVEAQAAPNRPGEVQGATPEETDRLLGRHRMLPSKPYLGSGEFGTLHRDLPTAGDRRPALATPGGLIEGDFSPEELDTIARSPATQALGAPKQYATVQGQVVPVQTVPATPPAPSTLEPQPPTVETRTRGRFTGLPGKDIMPSQIQIGRAHV